MPQRLREQGTTPLISSSGEIDSHNEAKVKAPGVATGRSGSIGNVFFIEKDYWPLNTVLYVKDFHGNDERFVYYLLRQFDLLKYASGAGVPTLNRNHVHDIEIGVPVSIEEQKRIVAILDEAFAGIDTAIANTQKNLANARELFESYLNNIFTQRGEGWEERKLKELCKITSSKRVFKSEYTESGIPFYRTKEIKELANGKKVSTELFISEKHYEEILSKYGVPKAGDVLMTAIGTIGEIYVVESKEQFYFKDGNVLWLKDLEDVSSDYLRYALMSFVDVLKRMSHGSAYSALPIEKLKEHTISVPTKDVQDEIVSKLDNLSHESLLLESIYQQKLSALNELKQSLLQQAFSGQLTANRPDPQAVVA